MNNYNKNNEVAFKQRQEQKQKEKEEQILNNFQLIDSKIDIFETNKPKNDLDNEKEKIKKLQNRMKKEEELFEEKIKEENKKYNEKIEKILSDKEKKLKSIEDNKNKKIKESNEKFKRLMNYLDSIKNDKEKLIQFFQNTNYFLFN